MAKSAGGQPVTIGQLEKKLTKIARRRYRLAPGFKAKIFGPRGWDVRSDAKLRNLG